MRRLRRIIALTMAGTAFIFLASIIDRIANGADMPLFDPFVIVLVIICGVAWAIWPGAKPEPRAWDAAGEDTRGAASGMETIRSAAMRITLGDYIEDDSRAFVDGPRLEDFWAETIVNQYIVLERQASRNNIVNATKTEIREAIKQGIDDAVDDPSFFGGPVVTFMRREEGRDPSQAEAKQALREFYDEGAQAMEKSIQGASRSIATQEIIAANVAQIRREFEYTREQCRYFEERVCKLTLRMLKQEGIIRSDKGDTPRYHARQQKVIRTRQAIAVLMGLYVVAAIIAFIAALVKGEAGRYGTADFIALAAFTVAAWFIWPGKGHKRKRDTKSADWPAEFVDESRDE